MQRLKSQNVQEVFSPTSPKKVKFQQRRSELVIESKLVSDDYNS